MAKRYLEIVQLDNGDVILRDEQDDDGEEERDWRPQVIRRASENGEPMVRLRFAPGVLEVLAEDVIEVAAAMLQAAADALGTLRDPDSEEPGIGWQLLTGSRRPSLH